mmetsp:Transcript_1721/g.2529  ORF Transcript_1721/g.2529 Transcript_1721/m.2529 type:complete len:695 (+) Transcript_1721:297-2381(+)
MTNQGREQYVLKHNLDAIMMEMFDEIMERKPVNVPEYMIYYLKRKRRIGNFYQQIEGKSKNSGKFRIENKNSSYHHQKKTGPNRSFQQRKKYPKRKLSYTTTSTPLYQKKYQQHSRKPSLTSSTLGNLKFKNEQMDKYSLAESPKPNTPSSSYFNDYFRNTRKRGHLKNLNARALKKRVPLTPTCTPLCTPKSEASMDSMAVDARLVMNANITSYNVGSDVESEYYAPRRKRMGNTIIPVQPTGGTDSEESNNSYRVHGILKARELTKEGGTKTKSSPTIQVPLDNASLPTTDSDENLAESFRTFKFGSTNDSQPNSPAAKSPAAKNESDIETKEDSEIAKFKFPENPVDFHLDDCQDPDTFDFSENRDITTISPEQSESQRRRYSLTNGRRTSVFSGMNTTTLKSANTNLPNFAKSPEQLERIEKATKNIILFSHLSEKDCKKVYRSMAPKTFQFNDIIVKFGEQSPYFCIIESGPCEVYQRNYKTNEEEKIATLGPGDYFGEIALMYDEPSPIMVKAIENSTVVWVLKREYFQTFLMQQSLQKRESHMRVLSKVDVVNALNLLETSRVADCLVCNTYEPGTLIVELNTPGTSFYMISKGTVHITHVDNDETREYDLQENDYFGEIALINQSNRVIRATASTKVTLLTLDRVPFYILLSPLFPRFRARFEHLKYDIDPTPVDKDDIPQILISK